MKLTKLTMVEMKQVLARQTRDYGIDEEQLSTQYPVVDQNQNLDDTMVTNIGMERTCGLVDYRFRHLKHLQAASRSIILENTQSLQNNKPVDFRGFKELETMKELRLK
ncbi:MAG: hypothetical protein AAGC99_02150 [Pseudomonadota bacterium]